MKTIESRMLLPVEKSLLKYRGVFKTQANISWKFLRKQLTAESHELFSFKYFLDTWMVSDYTIEVVKNVSKDIV